MGRQRKSTADRVAEAENGDGGGTATIDDAPVAMEPGEQATMFPELDESDPKHKDLLKAVKAFHKSKANRDALLSTAKEDMDAKMQKVIALMHECGLEKFRHEGVEACLITTKEKVVVDIEEEDGEE